MRASVLGIALVGGVALAAAFAVRGDPAPAEPAARGSAGPTAAAAPGAGLPEGFVVAADAQLSPEELRQTFVLPDGTRVRALNGVEDTSTLIWPNHQSKAPIVEIERGPLYDYYVHADGARSSTVMTLDPNTGKRSPSALVMLAPAAVEHSHVIPLK